MPLQPLVTEGNDTNAAHPHSLELNRAAEALEILQRPTVGPLLQAGWAPYWRVRVAALHAPGRHREELHVAREGLSRHPDAPILMGIELPALAALGRTAEILSQIDELLEIRATAIKSLIVAGDELHAHGHPEAAERVWERLVRVLRRRAEVAGCGGRLPGPEPGRAPRVPGVGTRGRRARACPGTPRLPHLRRAPGHPRCATR